MCTGISSEVRRGGEEKEARRISPSLYGLESFEKVGGERRDGGAGGPAERLNLILHQDFPCQPQDPRGVGVVP